MQMLPCLIPSCHHNQHRWTRKQVLPEQMSLVAFGCAYKWFRSVIIIGYLKSSLEDKLRIPPQLESDRKSTGLVTCGIIGNRKKKSSSCGLISSFINRICNHIILNNESTSLTLKLDKRQSGTHLKGHLRSEDEFIFLEETSSSVNVHRIRDVIYQIVHAFVHTRGWMRFLDGVMEDNAESLSRGKHRLSIQNVGFVILLSSSYKCDPIWQNPPSDTFAIGPIL